MFFNFQGGVLKSTFNLLGISRRKKKTSDGFQLVLGIAIFVICAIVVREFRYRIFIGIFPNFWKSHNPIKSFYCTKHFSFKAVLIIYLCFVTRQNTQ